MFSFGITSGQITAPAAPAAVTMVAGTDGTQIGYLEGSFGTISGEPLSGQDFVGLTYNTGDTGTILGFNGDAVSALSGKGISIDGGIPYSFDAADLPPSYNTPIPGLTIIAWFGTGPVFSNGISYVIRIE